MKRMRSGASFPIGFVLSNADLCKRIVYEPGLLDLWRAIAKGVRSGIDRAVSDLIMLRGAANPPVTGP
jgi:hypothetical protein